MALVFDRSFDPPAGVAESVAPGIRRILAPNPGPYTFRGTNTYLVGTDRFVVVDPGPDDATHVAAILEATGGRIDAILLTHGHRDHSGALARLVAETGAPVLASPLLTSEGEGASEWGMPGAPDQPLADGDIVATEAGPLRVIETPGHAADHLAFALEGTPHLFSGDHVMAWSTSVVIPPGGSMAAYMKSLARIAARPEALWWPGHGGPARDGPAFAAALAEHRRQREAMILAAVRGGARDLSAIVASVYAGLDPALAGAAALSAEAHLFWLSEKGAVRPDDEGRWFPT